jgi:hypothetical protein
LERHATPRRIAKDPMNPIQALPHIPTEWGTRLRCPLCSKQGLSVVSTPGAADRLQCPACGLSFEVEQGGQRLRLTGWPRGLPVRPELAGGAWVSMADLRAAARKPAAPPAEDPALLEMIRKLRALGNTHKQILAVLEQNLPDPARRKAALAIEARLERQEQSRQQRRLMTWLGIVALVAIGVVAVGATLTGGPAPAASGPTATFVSPAAAAQAAALAQITDGLHLATPVVYQYPSDPSRPVPCPLSAGAAADLFGGVPADWQASNGGWIMLNPTRSANLNIPNGMTAAYLVVGSRVGLADVQGPAQMLNVYYVVVSCPVY